MKKLLFFFFLQCKRILCQPGFAAILLLIPLAAAGISLAAADSGALTVALACEDPADPLGQAVVERLCAASSPVRYLPTDAASAEQAVKNGEADAAWIFRADLEHRLSRFAAGDRQAAVRVIQPEESTSLRLSRELLQGALYPELSFFLTQAFVSSTFPEADEALLRKEYDGVFAAEGLLQRETAEGALLPSQGNLLTAVLRGLLALIIQLAGLAAVPLAAEDRRRGVWSPCPLFLRWIAPYLTCLASTLLCSLAVSALLPVSSVLSGDPLPQMALLLLYAFAAAGFSFLFSLFFSDPVKAACAIPPLMIALTLLSPIFFTLPPFLSSLSAATHYLSAAADPAATGGLLLYGIVPLAVALPPEALRSRIFPLPRLTKKAASVTIPKE